MPINTADRKVILGQINTNTDNSHIMDLFLTIVARDSIVTGQSLAGNGEVHVIRYKP